MSFKVAPDFDTPTDDNGDNVYEVYVIARDNVVPVSFDSDPLIIYVQVINAPDFAINSTYCAVDSGFTHTFIVNLDADTAGDSVDVVWSLLGPDAGAFALRFAAAAKTTDETNLNFINSNGDGTYNVTVQAAYTNAPFGARSQDLTVEIAGGCP